MTSLKFIYFKDSGEHDESHATAGLGWAVNIAIELFANLPPFPPRC
jgi:hypothetical protein